MYAMAGETSAKISAGVGGDGVEVGTGVRVGGVGVDVGTSAAVAVAMGTDVGASLSVEEG